MQVNFLWGQFIKVNLCWRLKYTAKVVVQVRWVVGVVVVAVVGMGLVVKCQEMLWLRLVVGVVVWGWWSFVRR